MKLPAGFRRDRAGAGVVLELCFLAFRNNVIPRAKTDSTNNGVIVVVCAGPKKRRAGDGPVLEVGRSTFCIMGDLNLGKYPNGHLEFGPEFKIPRGDNVVEYAPSIFNHIISFAKKASRTRRW